MDKKNKGTYENKEEFIEEIMSPLDELMKNLAKDLTEKNCNSEKFEHVEGEGIKETTE